MLDQSLVAPRITLNRWCELCSSYHSAKNYRRERERCTTLSGNKSVDVPPLSPNLSETNLSELYEGSHSLFDGISRTPLPFHDERNETRTDLEADYPGNFRHGNTTNREYGDEINHLTATEIRGALPPTSHYKAALSNEVSQLAFKVTAVDSRINSELSLEAEHNVADIFLEQDFLHKADGAFDNVNALVLSYYIISSLYSVLFIRLSLLKSPHLDHCIQIMALFGEFLASLRLCINKEIILRQKNHFKKCSNI